jgi:hypothetical protein
MSQFASSITKKFPQAFPITHSHIYACSCLIFNYHSGHFPIVRFQSQWVDLWLLASTVTWKNLRVTTHMSSQLSTIASGSCCFHHQLYDVNVSASYIGSGDRAGVRDKLWTDAASCIFSKTRQSNVRHPSHLVSVQFDVLFKSDEHHQSKYKLLRYFNNPIAFEEIVWGTFC